MIVLIPGVGMFSAGADPHAARIAGEFFISAINAFRGAEAVSSYEPITDREKFRVEYWELEERKLRMRPSAPPLTGRVAIVTGGASGIGLAITRQLAEAGACVAVLDTDRERAEKAVADLPAERAIWCTADVSVEAAVDSAFRTVVRHFGGVDIVVNNAGFAAAASLVDTTVEEWDALHAVLARGSFLVSRAAARVMIDQRRGGDIVYVVSKNAVAAGPANVAYGAAKADQAHQVRLLATELGPHRHTRQRCQSGRRSPRVWHLLRRMARAAGRGVRRGARCARGVLRQPHPARCRGAARACGRRRDRARQRHVEPHNRVDRAGRRRAPRRLPTLTRKDKGDEMPVRITADAIQEIEGAGAADHTDALEHTVTTLGRAGIDGDAVIAEIARFSVAAPSWAVGTGGTRFGRFPGGGEPRTTEEKLDDVAALNALTGANRTVSLHVPWDDPANPAALRAYAAELGIGFDAMNSNTFQDNPSTTGDGAISYKFGSFASVDPGVRKLAVAHTTAVVELGRELGSKAITVWLADGTNHPGQGSFRGQFERVVSCLREVHDHLPADWLMYTEHKPYEPAFYSSVNNDWGTSLLLAQAAGERARCLVDLGHHLPNTNIELVVSRLAMTGRLGGFHFNDSMYGDDDLTVGSIRPYRLFLVLLELLEHGDGVMPDLGYMIDASHNLKDPLEDLIQSTDALQCALAQALLLQRDALAEAQADNDPARAAEVLHAAFRTDVRALVAEARSRNGAARDPIRAFRGLAYRAKATAERGTGTAATGL